MVTAARIIDENGTLAVTIDGREWHGVTQASRFWDEYQAWLDAGNSPDLFVPPSPPTRAEIVDQRLATDPVLSDLVGALADRFGVTRDEIVDEIKGTNQRGAGR